MGLDVYAGTMTRYYSHDWKTIVQQIAAANGQECVVLDACGNEIKPEDDEAGIRAIQAIIGQWKENLAADLAQKGTPVSLPLWDENKECDYFTDKPDWEAFGALVLFLACTIQISPPPEYLDSRWGAFNNPIVKKCKKQSTGISLLSEVSMWLPIPTEAIFKTKTPTGEKAEVSTLLKLKRELEELNRQTWKADESTILSWRDDKYYVPVERKEPKRGFWSLFRKKHRETFRTEDLAQCAFSILYQAVNFAIEQDVPIILDY